MSDPLPVFEDLRAEGEELDALVRELAPEQWALPTPAEGWSVAHQIAHLAWTDRAALLALTDAQGFAAELEKAFKAPDTFVDEGAARGAALPPAELLADWRAGRVRLQRALGEAAPGVKFPWFGPPMSAASVATGRLMETWAHGQDVADALGVRRAPTDRLKNVVHIGVRARDFAFQANGLTPPTEPFRIELTAPSGQLWTYGPEDAPQRVTGTAHDFCLLATQRVHRGEVALRAEGPDADHWLDIVQAFAGPPGKGRRPAAEAPRAAEAARATAVSAERPGADG
ncbi:TIGR03084 family protein [Streptomyces sp. NA04227]|uniref:TIGR03084 family metal-binding protein n=1 Tax=Streptomyces sp. NA04227 TaxID=2742136 RepID=UPI0015920E7C|nr:TIGR03084 family metal-binding protein [Streptomyces sp. NA04227]QKW07197.1 TIGR03084 family protein [Streptomyces sp. NA04227]